MTPRRGLSLLGALIALSTALFAAAWMWLSYEARAPQVELVGAAALVLVASMLAARCLGHLLDSFGLGVRQPVRASMAVCPSCAAPRSPGAMRCSACMEML
jgi:hypothetical protein